ncbi:MAG: NAD(P)-dependent oxidoreductase [Rhodospirillaceae bacterium]
MALPEVGFIGLGAMGRGMALNLAKTAETLYASDLSKDALKILTDAGAVACASPAEVAKKTKIILICVPDAPQVRQIMFGKGGLAEAGESGLTVVDCTTMDRTDAIDIHREADEKGIDYWDCPVSGLPRRAADGTLTIMFGGSGQAFGLAKPFLDTCGSNVIHCGDIGAGQMMKALNNVIYNINIAGICELLPLAIKAGLDPELVLELVTSGSSRSFASEHFAPRIYEGKFDDDFPMAWAYKDILNMQKVAVEHKAMTPVMNAMTAIYQAAMAEGYGPNPKSSMIKVYEKALGVQFRKENKS